MNRRDLLKGTNEMNLAYIMLQQSVDLGIVMARMSAARRPMAR